MRRARRNPTVGTHPDLFEKHDTPVVVPHSSGMTDAQLKKLPRSAFTEAEWDELDEDVQEYIHEHGDSKKRIDNLVNEFVQRHKWMREGDAVGLGSHIRESLQEDFDNQIAELDPQGFAGDRHAERLIGHFTDLGFIRDDVERALLEALQDNNNWDYTWGTNKYGSAFFKASYTDSFYVDRSDLDEWLEGMYPDEIEAALAEINRETDLSLDYDDLFKKYGIEIQEYAEYYADADPKWDDIEQAVADALGEPEETEEDEVATPAEERIVYRFKDGFYVQDLLASELPAEGKTMGMCVGRSDMGYTKAVRAGTTKILSLRRPSGKPLFTIEAEIGRNGKITEIAQIKGKANRKPGWDVGKERQGKMKDDEVFKVLELLEVLKVDPSTVHDLRPALDEIEGRTTTWTKVTRENPAHHCGFCSRKG